jgi:dTDP-4-amino-4,6-dideoxygalactose transaminase
LYDSLLEDIPGVVTPRVPAGREHVYYLYTIRLDDRAIGHSAAKNREKEAPSDRVQKRLRDRGIASMVYYPVPLHLQPLYALLGGKPGDFRVSERASREVLSIPLYPEMTSEQIKRVAEAVREATKR